MWADPRHQPHNLVAGGRYDSEEDRSPSLDAPGPKAFGRRIQNAEFTVRFRAPTNIGKYGGESNPSV